jgi:hypothetical protein
MKLYITLSGGWDKSIDEIPEPNVLLVAGELEQAITQMIDYMVEDPGISDPGFDNIYPLVHVVDQDGEPTNESKRALKLIETMVEADRPDSPEYEEASKELAVMLRHELDKHGRLEMMQFWDCYEGAFFAIFAKEI